MGKVLFSQISPNLNAKYGSLSLGVQRMCSQPARNVILTLSNVTTTLLRCGNVTCRLGREKFEKFVEKHIQWSSF